MCFRHIIVRTPYKEFAIYTNVTNNIITIITIQYKICRNKKVYCVFYSELQIIAIKRTGSMFQHFVSLLSRYMFQDFVHIPPRSSCTDVWSAPPVINIPVKFVGEVIVQHSAQAAQKLVVDEFSCAFPPKVRVVKVVIGV